MGFGTESFGAGTSPSGAGSTLTTKGDVQTFSTQTTRLGVGADTTVLTADSTQATGLKWAVTPAANGVLLNETVMADDTTESYTLSGIATGYKKFVIQVIGKQATTADTWQLRLNNDSGSNYNYVGGYLKSTTGGIALTNGTGFQMGGGGVTFGASNFNQLDIEIGNSTQAIQKSFMAKGGNTETSGASFLVGGYWNNTANEISRIDILAGTAGRKWKTGTTIRVWGYT